MTTIAFRDGVMATDSLVTDGSNIYRGTTKKIYRIGDSLLSMCGNLGLFDVMVDWVSRGMPLGDLPNVGNESDFAAMLVSRDRLVGFTEKFRIQEHTAEFHAMGSGNEIALGAMAMGATAEQAVETACRFDVYSAGPIQVERLTS